MTRHGTFRCAALLAVLCPLSLGAATKTYDYEYDAAGRLTAVRTAESAVEFSYDDAGNLVTRAAGPNPAIFSSGFEGGAP